MAAPMKPAIGPGYNIDLNDPVQDFTKLHRASWLGNEKVVRSCLRNIPAHSKDIELRTPLHLAAAKGHTVVVQMLMEADINFNSKDSKGKTPIMKAIECYHEDTAKTMIAMGADLTVIDIQGNTAMHIALKESFYQLAEYMLHYVPICNVCNKEGVTPMHMVATGTSVKLARKFINRGASVNAADKTGRTPLMLACKRGNFPMVALLLKYGSDPRQKDSNGWTSIDCASVMGHTSIIDILERHTNDYYVVNETGTESSSTEEEEIRIRHIFKYSSHQRVVPIKIESECRYLKGQKKSSSSKEGARIKYNEMEEGGIRDTEGKLLPMPDVLSAIHSQANKLGEIHKCLIDYQQVIMVRANDYKELLERAKMLCKERKRLIHKRDNQRNKTMNLTQQLQDAPSIQEKQLLSNEINFLRKGLQDLKNDYNDLAKERGKLQYVLGQECTVSKTTINALKARADQLKRDNEMLYEKLVELNARTDEIKIDLRSSCKNAEDLVMKLKMVLRGTHKLLQEKSGEMNKIMREFDSSDGLISNTKRYCNRMKEENIQVNKNIQDVDSGIKSVRKRLRKIYKHIEIYPFTKHLMDAGVLLREKDEKNVSGTSKSKMYQCLRKRKRHMHELQAEPEIGSFSDKYASAGLMNATLNAPTVCKTDLEMTRYSWIEDSIDDQTTDEVEEEPLTKQKIARIDNGTKNKTADENTV